MATAAMAIKGMDRLFGGGTLAGRGDAQLVEAFLADRDESAFAALVARHGPMVLATCRAVLRDPAAADDAFQATFVVLARKAGSVRGRDALGGWLHRVAYRTAVQAAREAARRRDEERKAAEMRATLDTRDDLRDDLRAAIHAEVERLPESLRLPLVLCDLEGRSREQAAEELRWSEWLVRGRLQRGRARLRHRLTARGLAPAAGFGAAAMAGESLAAVPEALAAATVRTAVAAATGKAVAAGVAGIAARTIRLMLAEKVRHGALVALAAIGVAGSSAGVALMALPKRRDGPMPAMTKSAEKAPKGEMAKAEAPAARADAPPTPSPAELRKMARDLLGAIRGDEPKSYRGAVVDPAGRPVAGAKVYLTFSPDPDIVRATTGPDGRFAFAARVDATPGMVPRVVAEAEGFAIGGASQGFAVGDWSDGPPDDGRDLTVTLAADQPVEGRLVDLEGRPIAGAQVHAEYVFVPKKGDLEPFLRALKAHEDGPDRLRNAYLWHAPLQMVRRSANGGGPVLLATTDARGRFVLKGLGRDRLVDLRVQGPTIRPLDVHLLTRPGEPIRVPLFRGEPRFGMRTIYGPRLDLAASPSRPIEGVVRDRSTGEPVAGATVSSYKLADQELGNNTIVQAKSDAKGHYRLVGMPQGSGNEVMVIPPAGAPYLPAMVKLPDPPGLGPIAHDLPLDRGVQVEARVVDEGTGSPVHAWVTYHVAVDNPALEATPAFREMQYAQSYMLKATTDADGKVKLAGFPGHGALVVETMDRSHPSDGQDNFRQDFVPVVQMFHQAMAEVDIPKDARTFTKEIRLDPGRVVEGTVVDPDGKPLEGAEVYGLTNLGYWETLAKTSAFKVVALVAGRPDRSLVFRHEGRKLAGWIDVKNEETGHPKVRLEPWASAKGRVVDAEGRPRANLTIEVLTDKPRLGGGSISNQPEHIRTDDDGRFRVEGMAPGLGYKLYFQPGNGMRSGKPTEVAPAKPGETRDLGNVTATFQSAS